MAEIELYARLFGGIFAKILECDLGIIKNERFVKALSLASKMLKYLQGEKISFGKDWKETINWINSDVIDKITHKRFKIDDACANGYLELAKWMYVNCKNRMYDMRGAIGKAAYGNHIGVIRWLLELPEADEMLEEYKKDNIFYLICTNGNTELLKLLYDRCGLPYGFNYNFPVMFMHICMYTDHLDVAKWIYEHAADKSFIDGYDDIYARANLKIIKWIDSVFNYHIDKHLFLDICNRNKADVVEWVIINKCCDVNATSIKCFGPPLFIACHRNDIDMVRVLLEHKVNMETINKSLNEVAKVGNIEICKLLIEYKADIHYDERIFQTACKNGNLDFAKWLVENGIEINKSINLADLSDDDHYDVVKWLVENGAREEINKALVFSCREDRKDVVEILLESKADINCKIKYGPLKCTPLAAACINEHIELAEFLIEQKADIYAHNEFAFEMMCEYHRYDVIRWFVEKEKQDSRRIVHRRKDPDKSDSMICRKLRHDDEVNEEEIIEPDEKDIFADMIAQED